MGSADQRMVRSAALEAMRVAILVAICLAYAAAVEAVKKDVDSETASLGKKVSPGSEMPLAAGLHDWVENVTDVTAEYNASAKALLAAHRKMTAAEKLDYDIMQASSKDQAKKKAGEAARKAREAAVAAAAAKANQPKAKANEVAADQAKANEAKAKSMAKADKAAAAAAAAKAKQPKANEEEEEETSVLDNALELIEITV